MIWRVIVERHYSGAHGGSLVYNYTLECGHTFVSSVRHPAGSVVGCIECETPPEEAPEWDHLSTDIAMALRELRHIAKNSRCVEDTCIKIASDALTDDIASVIRNTRVISSRLMAMGSSGRLGDNA